MGQLLCRPGGSWNKTSAKDVTMGAAQEFSVQKIRSSYQHKMTDQFSPNIPGIRKASAANGGENGGDRSLRGDSVSESKSQHGPISIKAEWKAKSVSELGGADKMSLCRAVK
jgi:hypothetical protein